MHGGMPREADDPTIPETDNEILNRVYRLSGPQDAAEVYDEWAASYDEDTVGGMGYVAPALAARRLASLVSAGDTVLDTGCGTGLVGAELARLAEVTIDGVDLSTAMLERAEQRGVYRNLTTADLTRPMAFEDDTYDALVCVGILTEGHLGPEPLDEMVRVVRPGGPLVATVLGTVWEEGGFRSHVAGMVDRGLVRLVEAEEAPYHEREGITCRMLVLEVV